ncbi:MAG: lipid-A-disaccharide synthase [bacterium]|nr:lipid-A-disaccharide synthase [bacterium]
MTQTGPSIMTPSQEILIVAGEASGDLHGGALVRALLERRPGLRFFGIGGDRMSESGVQLIRHVREMSFLGFFEVARHLPFIRRVFGEIVEAMESRRPALAVFIDYPGLNLKLALQAKKRNIPVVYYVSPQVWAWGRGRVPKIARRVDKMLVLFDFEEPIYREAGLDVVFTGHPLKDTVRPSQSRAEFFRSLELDPDKPLLGLLPGSRKQEVQRLLPAMIGAVRLLKRDIPGLQSVMAAAPTLSDPIYLPFTDGDNSIRTVRGRTYEVMSHSDAALVASGTATLETALCGTPMVILYRMSPLSYWIGRGLVRVPYIGLANIVAGKKVAPELLQNDAEPGKIREAVLPYFTDKALAESVRAEWAEVGRKLGPAGASGRAADEILRTLDERGKK